MCVWCNVHIYGTLLALFDRVATRAGTAYMHISSLMKTRWGHILESWLRHVIPSNLSLTQDLGRSNVPGFLESPRKFFGPHSVARLSLVSQPKIITAAVQCPRFPVWSRSKYHLSRQIIVTVRSSPCTEAWICTLNLGKINRSRPSIYSFSSGCCLGPV